MGRGDALKEGTLWQRNTAAAINALDDDITALLITSGTYTPTLTGVANVASSTAYQCQYYRVKDMVTVSGKVDITATAAAPTLTQLGISIPIASNFGANEDCAGVAGSSNIAGEAGAIVADATNDRARLLWSTNTTSSNSMYFHFTYQII